MRAFERRAVASVAERACHDEAGAVAGLERICRPYGLSPQALVRRMLSRPITVNFHPDRFDGAGRWVIDGLVADGQYHGQFRTGTTNGGRSAHPGGDRFLWEQRMFSGSYPEEARDRPKYGALNLLNDLDGASARFGSCYLTLTPDVLPRCTFSYGDSSTSPETLCTAETFYSVACALLRDVEEHGKLLNRRVGSVREAVDMLTAAAGPPRALGRNLDDCIEVQLHGELSLKEDAAALYLDESFRGTRTQESAEELARRYRLELCWIPARRLPVGSIGDSFRGPMMRPLAEEIDARFCGGGRIDAELIGRASRSSVTEPECWRAFGDEAQRFQYFKQLWHTTARFGDADTEAPARSVSQN